MTARTLRHPLRWATLALSLLLGACGTSRPVDEVALQGGIGGTGIQSAPKLAGGIGGTGIRAFGVVQGFGSIFVNNREYEITRSTDILIDGVPTDEQALHVGDIVSVAGQLDAQGRAFARGVTLNHPVQGPVESVDASRRQLVILGQTIRLPAGIKVAGAGQNLDLAAIQPGDVINISGWSQDEGQWLATRVTRLYAQAQRPAQIPLILQGRLSEAPGGLALGSLRLPVELLQGTAAALAPGQAVILRALQQAGQLHILSLQRAPDLLGKPGERIELSGFLGTPRQAGVIRLQGHQDLPISGTLTGLGEFVRLEGRLLQGGRLAVEQLQIDPSLGLIRLGRERPLPAMPLLNPGNAQGINGQTGKRPALPQPGQGLGLPPVLHQILQLPGL